VRYLYRAIFFDLDGVLTTDSKGSYTTCKNIQKHVDLPLDKVLACYSKYGKDLVLGKVKFIDIWEDFCGCLNKNLDIGMLHEAFVNTPKNERMFSLVKKLRQNGYKVGIITDNNLERIEILKKSMRLSRLFDVIVVSAEIGVKKDDPKIFETALNLLGIEPNEAIFVDNAKDNLIVPKKLGFKTFFYDEQDLVFERFVKYLINTGVKVD